MKKIYLILTFTGTMLSRVIKIATKDEFAHVSIALDQELKEMYSFGRLNPYNPFLGGFVHESIESGTFKRFENTTVTNIYTLEVSDYQYRKVKRLINYMKNSKSKYKFNILGLVAAGFRYKVEKVDSYYCAEFVKRIMDASEIENNLPEVVKPEDFKSIDNIHLHYTGLLKDYQNQVKD